MPGKKGMKFGAWSQMSGGLVLAFNNQNQALLFCCSKFYCIFPQLCILSFHLNSISWHPLWLAGYSFLAIHHETDSATTTWDRRNRSTCFYILFFSLKATFTIKVLPLSKSINYYIHNFYLQRHCSLADGYGKELPMDKAKLLSTSTSWSKHSHFRFPFLIW